MITYIEANMIGLSVRVLGEKIYSIKDDDIAEQIVKDITKTFGEEILEVHSGVDVEHIQDFRSTKDCVLFECDVLLNFKAGAEDKEQTIKIILSYLQDAYVKPFKK